MPEYVFPLILMTIPWLRLHKDAHRLILMTVLLFKVPLTCLISVSCKQIFKQPSMWSCSALTGVYAGFYGN